MKYTHIYKNIFNSFFFILLANIVYISAVASADTYKIGVILPLTGDAASLGQASKNGVLMAYDTLSSEDKKRIEITFEDDALKLANTVSAFRKLVSINKINAAVCLSSGSCKALAPLAEKEKIPLLALASDSAISKNRKYAFNFWVTPDEESKILLPEAHRRGYRHIAIAYTIQDGAIAMRDSFLKENHDEIDVVATESFPGDLKDFRSAVTKIAAKKPDAILTMLMPGQAGIFVKQLRQANCSAQIFGYETLEDRGEVAASGNSLVGAWFTTAASSDSTFSKTYSEKFPGASLVTASNGYDTVLLLAMASEKNTNPDDVATILQGVKDFKGASGQFSATGDNRFTLPAVLKTIEKDEFKELK